MFNLTHVIIVLVYFYDVCVLCESHEGFLNVGTTLFQSDDLNKKMWSLADIRLLEARRRLQSILPSPRSIDTLNEDYINDLIKYFTIAFRTVKREASDGTDVIMERALADTAGGFFKVFVLPVTKYAYYGGSVSEDSAMKIFQFYENLKSLLHTNGCEWRNPNEYILNSISVSVIPLPHHSRARNMRNLCGHLAFYESYNNSFAVPTPYVDYEANAMFLPIRNESLVLLDSPSSSRALMKYYDIAESCCHLNSQYGCDEFDSRFQHWLSKDVVPHLNDDKLYRAFYSVLSLLDKSSKQLYEKIPEKHFEYYEHSLTSLLPCMTSKKSLILFVILFIEIIWCVPTLIYMLCCRKKRKTNKKSQFFKDIFKRRNYSQYKCEVGRSDITEEGKFTNGVSSKNTFRVSEPHMKDTSLVLIQKARTRNTDADTQYPSNTSKRSFGQVTQSFPDIVNSNDSFMLIDETQTKSSVKKQSLISSEVQTINDINDTSYFLNVSSKEQPRFATFKSLDTTIRKMTSDKCGNNFTSYVKRFDYNETVRNPSSKMREDIQKVMSNEKDETNDICPCLCCIDKDKKDGESSTKRRAIADVKKPKSGALGPNTNVTLQPCTRPGKSIDKFVSRRVIDHSKTTRTPKNTKMPKPKGISLNSDEPLLEIRINKLTAKMTVDMDKDSRASKKSAKPSKIPRRTAIRNVNEQYAQSKSISNPINSKFYGCRDCDLSQQATKKRSADELDIKKKVVKHNKMNLTL